MVVNGALVDVSTVAQFVVSTVGRKNAVVQDYRNEKVPHEQSARKVMQLPMNMNVKKRKMRPFKKHTKFSSITISIFIDVA